MNIGDVVIDRYGRTGVVVRIHDNYWSTGENEAWLRGQERRVYFDQIDGPWIVVALDCGGSSTNPIDEVLPLWLAPDPERDPVPVPTPAKKLSWHIGVALVWIVNTGAIGIAAYFMGRMS